MYGGMGSSYGGYGGMGSSMSGYGGSSMYGGGGYGSSMYGSSMSGRGGMGAMGGMAGQDSPFFAPKPEHAAETPNRLTQIRELNHSFLDRIHTYSYSLCMLMQRLIDGLARLQAAAKAGKIPPTVAQHTSRFALALALSVLGGMGYRGLSRALQQRRQRLLWQAFLRQASPIPLQLSVPGPGLRAAL